MFERHPETRREVAARTRTRMERAVHVVKTALESGASPQERETIRQRQARNRFLIIGRTIDGLPKWDVYELRGEAEPEFTIGPFDWIDEAVARARDLLLGRCSIAFGNVRGAFRAPPRGSRLIVPDRGVDTAGVEVKVYNTPAGVVVAAS